MRTKVVFIDEDGSAYLENKDFESSGFNLGDSLSIDLGKQILDRIPFYSGLYCRVYDTVLVSKSNATFLTVRNGNAKEKYNLYEGQVIVINLCAHGEYWEKENAYSFNEVSNRLLYNSTESFANFRPLFRDTNSFYRSSSPVDDTYFRAESVRYCIKKYGIITIIDMADTIDEYNNMLALLDKNESGILQKCKVYPIGNDSGLYSKKFERSVLMATKLIIESEMPCMIHCRAGKRRSGFVCAILQSLYGMTNEEIMSDYMLSYKNNNGITYEDNPDRYEYLKRDTIKKILHHINGAEFNDLVNSTKEYLNRIGLGYDEIGLLMAKLH